VSIGAAGSRRSIAIALVTLAIGVTVVAGFVRRGTDEGAQCGAGFVVHGARCFADSTRPCPPPLVSSTLGCVAPPVRVLVPEATIVVGPSDWEAEGRVTTRSIHTGAFFIDAFEVTAGRWGGAAPGDAARAASGMTAEEAAAFCAHAGPGGRLPTEDEWIAAAVAGRSPTPRYPWGETGAVCRRAAWGLRAGPCARDVDGPDTVGAHPTGDSALGIHDMAGNVAEWVAPGTAAKGGSWASDLAADLRVWARLDLPRGARDPRVGLRCVYPP
jgi:formylglycine-generating enzyme required for sulfatase activity